MKVKMSSLKYGDRFDKYHTVVNPSYIKMDLPQKVWPFYAYDSRTHEVYGWRDSMVEVEDTSTPEVVKVNIQQSADASYTRDNKHLNIVERWAVGKKEYNAELERVIELAALATKDIKNKCGQYPTPLTLYNDGVTYYISNQRMSRSYNTDSPNDDKDIHGTLDVTYHWGLTIKELESRVRFLKSLDGRRIRELCEKTL